MRDILSTITKWWAEDETFGLATVVSTFRSAPRDPGAAVGTPEQRKEAFRRVRDEIDSRIREFVNDFRRKESSGRATAA